MPSYRRAALVSALLLTGLAASSGTLPGWSRAFAAPSAQSDQPLDAATDTQGGTDAAAQATNAPTVEGAPVSAGAADPLGVLVVDSELVRGPTTVHNKVSQIVEDRGGYLSNYYEKVGSDILSGVDIVDRVSRAYSVGPRALLVLLEMASGWVGSPNPTERTFPLGGDLPGLEPGLSEAADALNAAYYGAALHDKRTIRLDDGGALTLPSANPGSLAVLAWLGRDTSTEAWAGLESPSRFYAVWSELFEEPLWYQTGPAEPPAPEPQKARLPFAPGQIWFYVEGPHPAWGTGAAWSAVDFAPPPAGSGTCTPSPAWVTAAAAGRVVRSDETGLVIDADNDGFEETGWDYVYLHLSALERTSEGTAVEAGDRLGHPSCEGGAGGQTRVTLARKLDGAWIAADSAEAPMVLDGWIPIRGPESGQGHLVHGTLAPRVATEEKLPGANGVAALP
jgi:hypothetical protein